MRFYFYFASGECAASQIQLFLRSANVREAKYNCFCLQRMCGSPNTTVFTFSERAGSQIQMFLPSANVRQPKYKCIWSQY